MRHLRTGFDLEDRATLHKLLVRAQLLKRQRQDRRLAPTLSGRVVGMLFEKPSTRTVASFEAGTALLGGATVVLHGRDTQLEGQRKGGEPLRDAARVLGGYVDILVARMRSHEDVLELARHARIPVINGLTPLDHPCQAVADVLTVFERREDPFALTWSYVGEVTGAMHGLIAIASIAGFKLRVCVPPGATVDATVLARARQTSSTIQVVASPVEAVTGADVVCTDAWHSLDDLDGDLRERRLSALAQWRVDESLLAHAAPDHFVLHPLPAHRGLEITDDVLEGMRSVAFEQAKNRLPASQALLEWLLEVPIG
jgi:ornithine carbamoyltransferase